MAASDISKADARVVAQAPVEQQAASPVRMSLQPNPASPGAALSAAMKARLGQRGGVVKMSDGFDVFYGLVGDQPAPGSEVRSPVKSTAGLPFASRTKQPNNNGSVATSLVHRGGFVRKSDGFEVFYGLVGDQPGGGQADQPEPGAAAERCDSDLGDAVTTDGQGAARPPSGAMFSLATPAASYAPVSSLTPGCGDLQLDDREDAATITWLGAPMNKSAPHEFCMATPAASFAPVGCFGECEAAIHREHADMEKVASAGDQAQQLEQLGTAAVPFKAAAAKAAENSTTGNAQPPSHIDNILQRMGNWKPLGLETHLLKDGALLEESSPESSPKSSDLEAETSAEKPKLAKQHSKSFDNSGLQSRLASLDDAILRLKTLQ